MTGTEVARLVDALTEIAAILDKLGVPGLVALLLAGPVVVLVAFIGTEIYRSTRTAQLVETLRKEANYNRKEMASQLEVYRKDTHQIVHELGENQKSTADFYTRNVGLVKGYEAVSKGLQDVVVSNTRAMERLTVILEERRSK